MYREAQKIAWDNYSILDYAKKESREEGAIAKEREIAKNFKAKGIDLQIIADATGLSMEEMIAL